MVDEEEKKELQKQFESRNISLLSAGILLILLGGWNLFFGTLELMLEGMIPLGIISLVFSGKAAVALGVWITTFAKKREDVGRQGLMVYERKIGLVLGWLIYICGLALLLAAFSMACGNDRSCLFVSFIAVGLLFGGTACFGNYRNRRIIFYNDMIYGVTSFGRNYSFPKSAVTGIKFNVAQGGYKVVDKAGKRLLRFESNMVHAEELYSALEGNRFVNWVPDNLEARRKETEVQWQSKDGNWQTSHVREIRWGLRALILFNVLLSVYLLFSSQSTPLYLKTKYRLLLMEGLPLLYVVYAWVFNKVMLWLPLSDVNASKDWKSRHISIGIVYIHGLFVLLSITLNVLWTRVNIIERKYAAYFLGCILFLVLWGISVFRMQKKPNRKLSIAGSALALFILVSGITPALIQAMSEKSEITHYQAKVTAIRESRAKYYTTYYAEVDLRGAGETEIVISKSAYEDLMDGKEEVVCVNDALFGIKYVMLHEL